MKYIKHIPLVLFAAFAIKFLLTTINYPEVAVLLTLSGLCGYFEYKQYNEEFKKVLASNQDLKLMVEANIKEVKDLKDHLSGIKAATHFQLQGHKK